MDILLDVLFALELLRPIKPFRIWMCATSFKRLDKFDLLEYNLRIILGAVHKLCRLGRGEGGSSKDDLLHRPYALSFYVTKTVLVGPKWF